MIQICIATLGRKRLRLVYKSIRRNIPLLPQSFELASPAEWYGTFYEHRADKYASDLRIDRQKCTSNRQIVLQKIPSERCTGPPAVY
ncbi:hypothetical protein TNCV_2778131 [Trichonephila clavipes]|nr:hypothetical protein TNCV_2778131 [Trichonephila clavipes]